MYILVVASRVGAVWAAEELLRRGADPDIVSSKCTLTPLEAARLGAMIFRVCVCVRAWCYGALPAEQSGSDVLAHACAMEDPSFAWRLIREHGADPTLRRRGVRECAGQSRPAAGRGCGYRAEQPRL